MTARLPNVSVIVPVWNVERYLSDCLGSIAAQTYADFEVIMVDDGSTDHSAEICGEWQRRDRRFVLVGKENGGLSSARNAGLRAARGKYVAFVDSDDLVAPCYLAVLMELAAQPGRGVACVGMERFSDEEGRALAAAGSCGARRRGRVCSYTPVEALCSVLYQTGGMVNSACGKLFRSDLLYGVDFKEGILYEDLEWIVRLLERMPAGLSVAQRREPLYYYRKRAGSILESFTPRRLDVLEITRQIEQRAEASGNPCVVAAARDRRFSANFDMFLQMYGAARGYGEQMAHCWEQIRRLRFGSLVDRHVRFKNRLGCLLSLMGRRMCGVIGSRLLLRLKG